MGFLRLCRPFFPTPWSWHRGGSSRVVSGVIFTTLPFFLLGFFSRFQILLGMLQEATGLRRFPIDGLPWLLLFKALSVLACMRPYNITCGNLHTEICRFHLEDGMSSHHFCQTFLRRFCAGPLRKRRVSTRKPVSPLRHLHFRPHLSKRYANEIQTLCKSPPPKERERETDPPPLFPATNQHQLRWKNPPSGPESPASRKHLSASLTNRIVLTTLEVVPKLASRRYN